MMDMIESRSMADLVETSLDFSSRVLTPLQESDATSLSFAAAAILLSFICSMFGITRLEEPQVLKNKDISSKNNEIEESFMKIRNNLIYVNDDSSLKVLEKEFSREEPANKQNSLEGYEATVEAFEDFMEWSRNETQSGEFLEEVMELAISKVKGRVDPADVFYNHALTITSEIFNSLVETFYYYFS